MKKKTYAVIGLGRFGMPLATKLAQSGAEVIGIDMDEERVRAFRDFSEYAFVAKNLTKEVLEDIGIQDCDLAVVCIGSRVETSILVTLNILNLGVPNVIAKASSAEQGEVLKRLGAIVVYPERDMALRTAMATGINLRWKMHCIFTPLFSTSSITLSIFSGVISIGFSHTIALPARAAFAQISPWVPLGTQTHTISTAGSAMTSSAL